MAQNQNEPIDTAQSDSIELDDLDGLSGGAASTGAGAGATSLPGGGTSVAGGHASA